MSVARGHRDYFASIAPLSDERNDLLAREAAESLQRQAEIEANDSISLDEYLRGYFSSR